MGAFSAAFSPAFGAAQPLTGLLQLVWKRDDYRGPQGIRLDGANRLWRYKRVPTSWTSSLLLDKKALTATAVDSPTQTQANAADEFILGGVDYRVEEGSWQHQALVNSGYTFRAV